MTQFARTEGGTDLPESVKGRCKMLCRVRLAVVVAALIAMNMV